MTENRGFNPKVGVAFTLYVLLIAAWQVMVVLAPDYAWRNGSSIEPHVRFALLLRAKWMLCFLWFAWSWFWLQSSGLRRSVWLDLVFVAVVPLVLCSVRINAVGDVADLNRTALNVARSIILAFLFVGVAWLVDSRKRIVPRVFPFLIAIAIMVGAVTSTFGDIAHHVTGEIVRAFVPVVSFLLCCTLIRVLGVRWVQEGNASTKSAADALVTTRDLFVLILGLAFLLAGLAPLLAKFGDLAQEMNGVRKQAGLFLGVSFLPVIAWLLALCRWRPLPLVGAGVSFCLLVFLLAVSDEEFAPRSSSLIEWTFGDVPDFEPVPMMSFVSTFWVGVCFRMHGWRLVRHSSDPITEPSA